MRYIADLHLHSKYSRACSKDLDLEHIAAWARIKGINIVSCSDFTHPQWFEDIKTKLEERLPGLYQLKPEFEQISQEIIRKDFSITAEQYHFILTTEISCIYSQGGKTRRVHLVIFAPNIKIVERINAKLNSIGNIRSDGRPILGLSAKELAKIVLDISPDCFVVPAHAWTPWFSVFGSMSGFDSLEECFEEVTPQIKAIETGLSSDPAMNWRWSKLNYITLISNSDAHSPDKLGREANVFEGEIISYQNIINAIKAGKPGVKNLRLDYTVEFFPEEGKYHLDGHRDCKVIFSPEQTKKNNNICPVCKKPLTVGVLNRVEKLADQKIDPENKIGYKNIIPLQEIIAQYFGVGVKSKKVFEIYKKVINRFGSEFNILIDAVDKDLFLEMEKELAQGILNMRSGKIKINAGYDGVFGVIKVCDPIKKSQQKFF